MTRTNRSLLALTTAGALLAASAPAGAQPEAPPEAVAEPAPSPQLAVRMHGRVIDGFGKPVAGAGIYVENGNAALQITGDDGRFELESLIGDTLVIYAEGYETTRAIASGDPLDDIVLLTTSQAETIEVSGEAPPASPGAAKLDRTELQRIPGAGGDMVKALSVMPGVVNSQLPVGYSGIAIRGSSPQDSKVLIDNFEVPLLFHAIGARSILPTESIEKLEYIPGGFDVAFGRASSGIVALTTRPGNEQRTTQAEVSVLDGGLLAQGAIGKRTRYMLGLRRSLIDFVLPSLIPDDADLSMTTVPRYWDEQFRIDHTLSSKWRLSLSSIGADDVLELYSSKNEDAMSKRFYNRTRFARLTAAARYSDGPWALDLALSGLAQQTVVEVGVKQNLDVLSVFITPRAELSRTAAKFAGLTNVVWRLGVDAQVARGVVDAAMPDEPREGEPAPPNDPNDVSQKFHGVVWLPDFSGWTAISADLDPRIRVTTGLRTDVFAKNGQVAVQPRGELAVKLAKPWTARLSAGGFDRPAEYNTEALYDHLRAEHSTQVIAGLQYEPREGARIQASGYYSNRSSLITRNTDGSLGNNGRGDTIGGELLASYRDRNWFGWLSYSYSSSHRVDAPGEMERLFSYDQPHSLNAAASWTYGKWQFGGRFQLYSGLPYTPAIGSLFDSDRNVYVPAYAESNSSRTPVHHQLDLRIDRSWKWGSMLMSAFLDVQNVYANDTTITYIYSYDYSQQSALKSIPILPTIGMRGVL
ncbi:MAG: TonB-dependent receptor plug domain-containing protein [Kofleriaceae bacterium]|nr:TonB-dependent receptor plug domain-containing protein [Kofleriaceae bacterium]